MTVTALPPRPLEDIVNFACNTCQNSVRAIRAFDEDLRVQVRLITRRPDSPSADTHKQKIKDIKAKKAKQREWLNSHVDNDHQEEACLKDSAGAKTSSATAPS